MKNIWIPLLVTHNIVIFPNIITLFAPDNADAKKLIKDAIAAQKTNVQIGVAAEMNGNLYKVGVLANVSDFEEKSNSFDFILKAEKSRFKILNLRNHEHGYRVAEIEILNDEFPQTNKERLKAQVLLDKIQELWTKLFDYVEPTELFKEAFNNFNDSLEDLKQSADAADFTEIDKPLFLLCFNFKISFEESQEILEEMNFEKRLDKIIKALIKTNALEKVRREYLEEYVTEKEKNLEKDILLFSQKQIRKKLKDLGNDQPDNNDEFGEESSDLSDKYQQLKDKIPKKARKIIEDELKQLKNGGHESTIANLKIHLDYCINKLPWGKETQDNPDFAAVKNILDEDHYGLEKIKIRIREYLAVRKLNPESKAPILCFVGPPGVGKTSLGKSIARAINRKFTKISVGGARDEREIRGFPRTYVSSLPGKIIEGVIRAGSQNPVFMIDEIDKMGKEYGDANLASALLEVLDPEQNHSFEDNFIGFEFDLSKIFFIVTANMINESMPSALKDRLEIIYLPGYAEFEKIRIAQQYLIPKQLQETGVGDITFTKEAIELAVQYTDESGVRNLERKIHKILRAIALKIVSGQGFPRIIEPNIISQPDFLGSSALITEKVRKISAGVSIGLAWMETGGCILYIEIKIVKGTGQISKTINLGETLEGSIKVAQTLIREIYKKIDFNKKLLHVHISRYPDTDGPSAGLAIYIALESACRKKAIREKLAMTGAINLERLVLAVGGIREKILAAERAGIKEIILPKENEKDLTDVPQEIKDKLTFHLVETIDEAMTIAFPPKS